MLNDKAKLQKETESKVASTSVLSIYVSAHTKVKNVKTCIEMTQSNSEQKLPLQGLGQQGNVTGE